LVRTGNLSVRLPPWEFGLATLLARAKKLLNCGLIKKTENSEKVVKSFPWFVQLIVMKLAECGFSGAAICIEVTRDAAVMRNKLSFANMVSGSGL